MAIRMGQSVVTLIQSVRSDRRGATAVVFALGATALLGLVGFATEGGTWYLEKRHGQNAADAAATYGALALTNGSATPATDAQTWVRTTFSYSTAEATVTRGNYNSASKTFTASGTGNAIKAAINRTPSRMFSGLFLAADPTITETAVALVNANGNACVLAKSGGLGFAGSTSINASNCSLASNATGSNAISFQGNKATVTGGTLISSGGCSNCGNSAGYMLYQPPTTDPYASIQTLTIPPAAASTTKCQNMPALSGTVTLNSSYTYDGGSKMFCTTSITTGQGQNRTTTNFSGDLTLNSGTTLNLTPGTYIFYDASIKVNGGATLQCSTCTPGGAGVTIILTGDTPNKIGTLSIDGGATVNLNAPATNSFNAAFNGVLFYMDKNATRTNSCGNAPVSLAGNGNVHLTGGMYFPSVNVCYSGNVSSPNSATACTEIIGDSVTFTGNSTLNIAGCSANGTAVAKTASVQLVQ